MGTKRIKWTTNGVSFARGNYTPLIAKLDNSRVWLELRAWCTAHTFREEIRRLAQDFRAKEVEIKPVGAFLSLFRENHCNILPFMVVY